MVVNKAFAVYPAAFPAFFGYSLLIAFLLLIYYGKSKHLYRIYYNYVTYVTKK
jgi:hypothetical protein